MDSLLLDFDRPRKPQPEAALHSVPDAGAASCANASREFDRKKRDARAPFHGY